MIGSWFATDYDEAPHYVGGLPLEVGSGRDLAIVDQVVRGQSIVGRVTGDYGAVGVKMHNPGVPTRVSVLVHLDEVATRWWSDRVRPSRLAPELPRLVLVRAQGALRGAAVLARRQGLRSAGGAKATVEFDLGPEDLDEDGLLMVELAEPSRPAWTTGRIAARAALGLRLDKISVRPQGGPATVAAPVPTGCDLAIIPADVPEVFRLEVSPVTPAPPLPVSPTHKWARKKPARAGFKALRIARRASTRVVAEVHKSRPADQFGVTATDLLAEVAVELEVVKRAPGSITLRRTTPSGGPILVGLKQADRGLSCRVVPVAGA
ncbi:hypothetical protein [Actinoplanes sp. TFC3]|uniref:hypothetical protein n=1 Tax=Actinoplanes sp. TFC3 TaxID=1710355 RepID=UPI000830C90A|nr:hypothetical protein [Actinoplanes sp. TFC3]